MHGHSTERTVPKLRAANGRLWHSAETYTQREGPTLESAPPVLSPPVPPSAALPAPCQLRLQQP